ncbi:MAG: CvpA family protein [Burkholderiales bacterium]|nr:CvpA family protein [Burkholderiales bacterium]
MTAFDYAVLAILGLSIIVSVWRGAVREVLALASWVLAFLAAQAYAPLMAVYLPASLESGSLRLLAAFAIVFVLVLALSALIAIGLSRLVRAAGLGPLDRGLGAMFGVLRGMLIVLTLVLLCGLTAAPRSPVWRDAMLSPPLEAAALSVKSFLPEELSKRISYE